MNRKTLTDLLADDGLHKLVGTYLGGSAAESDDFAGLYTNLAGQLKADRFVVPVFGVQGSGKGTFLNALLFDRPVLPVEADETTCVPVEIVWASTPSGNARILYHDQREECVPADEDHLREFVDNARNPGNERGVNRVLVESDCDLLKSGLVLVDLPGIGSLTAKNVETTKRFLQDSVGLIFILRTIPPITQSDSIAIQLQWPRLPYAFFIQNRWNDESEREANDGLAHNTRVLREIAGRARVSLPPAGPQVYIVNAYRAWHGKLSRNDVETTESGLPSFLQAFRAGICEWPKVLSESVSKKLLFDLDKAHESVERQLDDLSKTRDQLDREMAEEKRRYDTYIRDVGVKVESAQQAAECFRQEMHTRIEEYRSSINKSFRNEMRTKMRAGIVDGPRLERAMNDEERVAFDEAIGAIHEKLAAFSDELRTKFENVKSWERQSSFRASTVRAPEKTKYENILPRALSAGGGIGAAALAAFLLGSNPVGWVVAAGLAAGAIGGLLGQWLGNKGREAVLDQRIKAVEPQVFGAIEKFVRDVSGQLERNVTEFIEEMMYALETWKSQQEAVFQREKKQRIATHQATEEEKRTKSEALKKDLKALSWYRSQVKAQ